MQTSIAYGVIAGIISYTIINGIPYLIMRASNGRIVPSNNYESSERWVIPPGSIIPSWM
jgi:AGZA family xanthine/uracil permease-like MFS transporter